MYDCVSTSILGTAFWLDWNAKEDAHNYHIHIEYETNIIYNIEEYSIYVQWHNSKHTCTLVRPSNILTCKLGFKRHLFISFIGVHRATLVLQNRKGPRHQRRIPHPWGLTWISRIYCSLGLQVLGVVYCSVFSFLMRSFLKKSRSKWSLGLFHVMTWI